MITYENGLFSIHTEHYSYLFRVNAYGLLEHLYFGAPVSDADAEAFRLRSGIGWGCSLLLDEKDPGSCPDVMALEWSSSGRGDFRESPIALAGCSAEPKYLCHEIIEGIAPMSSGLPQAQGAEEALRITLAQPGMEIDLYYYPFPHRPDPPGCGAQYRQRQHHLVQADELQPGSAGAVPYDHL